MPRYQQAVIGITILIVFILLTKSAPEKKHEAIINDPIAESSVTIGVKPSEAIAAPTPNIVPPAGLKTNSALAKTARGTTIFYEQNPEQHWPIASLTKLMTAVVAIENLLEGTARNDRIKRMMIISDNAAAEELAAELGTTFFIELMNQKAANLGMTQTGFSDTTGLSYLNQSTVYDLDRLTTYILNRHPEVFQWSREQTIVVNGRTLTNINEFVTRPDFLGGKTGYTDEASSNLVSVFTGKNGPITIIVLGTPDKNERFIQTEHIHEWISQHFKL